MRTKLLGRDCVSVLEFSGETAFHSNLVREGVSARSMARIGAARVNSYSDLSANDTKAISKHVFLQRALADNYVSGDLEVEKKYAKLLKAKFLGKPAFSGDWKKILKGRAAQGRRSNASVRLVLRSSSPAPPLHNTDFVVLLTGYLCKESQEHGRPGRC